jgi:hypothetical protein
MAVFIAEYLPIARRIALSASTKLAQSPESLGLARTALTGAYFAYFSALAWICIGVDSIVRPQQDNRRDALWFICFVPFMVAFWCLSKIHEPLRSRFERVTFWVLIVASALAMTGQIGNVFEIHPLQVLGFPLGAIAWMIGMIVYGIAIWRPRIVPWYSALALILWEPGSIVTGVLLAPISPLHERGGYSAGLEKGLGTLLIGVGLHLYARKRT